MVKINHLDPETSGGLSHLHTINAVPVTPKTLTATISTLQLITEAERDFWELASDIGPSRETLYNRRNITKTTRGVVVSLACL
jgi:hypothetical protein